MASCKDCFHWNACKKMLEEMWGHCIPAGYEGGAGRCEDFISTADVAPRAEVGEPLEDLLTEFDEFGMQPTILVPDAEGMAIEWKRKLEYAIGHIKAEVAREIILEIDELICCHANGDIDDKRLYILFDELKKKYTEGG